jgi:hypothetical protein
MIIHVHRGLHAGHRIWTHNGGVFQGALLFSSTHTHTHIQMHKNRQEKVGGPLVIIATEMKICFHKK